MLKARPHYLVYGELYSATAFLKWDSREELQAVVGSGMGMPGVFSHGNGPQWGAGVGSGDRAVCLRPLQQLRGGDAPSRGSGSVLCQ